MSRAKNPHVHPPFRKFRKTFDIALREGAILAKEAPDLSGREFRARLKRVVDDIFVLPPIAEEISDMVIAVVVDSVAYRIRSDRSDWRLVRKDEWDYAQECIDYVGRVKSSVQTGAIDDGK